MDPKTIKDILDEVSNTEGLSTKISKLKDYANNLELEIKNMKIAKFCFPITIVNLSDVLSTIREELAKLRQGPRGRDSLFPTIVGGGLVVLSRTGGGGGGVGILISETNGSVVPTVLYSQMLRREDDKLCLRDLEESYKSLNPVDQKFESLRSQSLRNRSWSPRKHNDFVNVVTNAI